MDDEQLPLVNRDASDSLQQQLSSYHERQRSRQQRRQRSKTRNERALELQEAATGDGQRNVPFKQPMEEHSVFPMGANVQLLVAVAMYQLQEKGLVELHKPVDEYWTVTDWRAFGKNQTCFKVQESDECDHVTFQHLLYMGSGIQSTSGERMQSLEQQIGAFIGAPLAFKPGTSYRYAEANYVLLAYMVERLSGLKLGEYLDTHVFQVLGLKLTTYDPYDGALRVRHGLVDQYVQFYAHRTPNATADTASDSSSGTQVVPEKHLQHMSTGSCAIYQTLDQSLRGLQSTGKDMHKIYTDLFHAHGHHSKLLQAKSIALIVGTRNPAYPAFAQGIGVDFEENPGARAADWPAKIAFCGSTACSTTCMAMQMLLPTCPLSLAPSRTTRLYFPSVDAFFAYKPRDFMDKRDATIDAFEKTTETSTCWRGVCCRFF
ncbi:Beta-lactamase, partial [Phytophthora infestans]